MSLVDKGLGESKPQVLVDRLVETGIKSTTIYCEGFLLGTLQNAVAGYWPAVPSVTRWSEATEDVAAFRRLVADGPLSVVPAGQELAWITLSQAVLPEMIRAACAARSGAGPETMSRS